MAFELEDLVQFLKSAAREKRFVPYEELMTEFGLSHARFGDVGTLLGIVSEYTYAQHGIWLSAVVVRKQSLTTDRKEGYPTGGFLDLNDTPSQVYRCGGYQRALSPVEKAFIRQEQQKAMEWALEP